MPYLPRIPRLGEIHWSELAHRGRKGFEKIPSSARSNVGGYVSEHSPTEEDLEEFSHDWSNVNNMRGSEEALRAVPRGNLKNRLRKITDGTSAQQVGGGIGALTGSAVGAGIGGTVMGLAKGKGAIGRGLLAGTAMGSLPGYFAGRNAVSKDEILTALRDELGPGAGIKQAKVETGFEEILRQLHQYKTQGKLTMPEFSRAIRALKVARGRDLYPTERLLVRRVILGRKDLPKSVIGVPKSQPGIKLPPNQSGNKGIWEELRKSYDDIPKNETWNAKEHRYRHINNPQFKFKLKLTTPKPPKPPKPPKLTGLPKSKSFASGKAVGIAAGAAAALAMLGLTAAKYWPRDEDSYLKD